MAVGQSPSAQQGGSTPGLQNKRLTMVGVADKLTSLQSEEGTADSLPQVEPVPLTWRRNPFQHSGERSVSIAAAASRLKKALRVAYVRAEAHGVPTSDKQRQKYERQANLHRQTLKPSFLRPPHTDPSLDWSRFSANSTGSSIVLLDDASASPGRLQRVFSIECRASSVPVSLFV
eukprot:COSAG06_NODE_1712_length_8632_cov_71.258409_3_plen_175_part_00